VAQLFGRAKRVYSLAPGIVNSLVHYSAIRANARLPRENRAALMAASC